MRTFYERPSKHQREDSYFDAFVSLEKEVPAGTWAQHEAPDYLLTSGSLVIGLEIIALVSSALAPIRNAQDKAFALAQTIAVERDLPIMEVKAKFRDENALVDAKEAALELVEIIQENLHLIDDSKNQVLNGFHRKYYSTIMANRGTRNGRKWLDAHRWGRVHMNRVKRNPIDVLQKAIDNKNTKLKDYLEKCTECWLLVGVDEWTAAEAVDFSSEGLEHMYNCAFNRAYFLRNIEGKLFRLRISSTRDGL
ncbi:MAG: hypothetical protein CSYNP_02247 [Syntrophus sp. SKADARSKE-3]|nr:hypothetical protein [Syntrophus sp. SKADARSKE-3]